MTWKDRNKTKGRSSPPILKTRVAKKYFGRVKTAVHKNGKISANPTDNIVKPKPMFRSWCAPYFIFLPFLNIITFSVTIFDSKRNHLTNNFSAAAAALSTIIEGNAIRLTVDFWRHFFCYTDRHNDWTGVVHIRTPSSYSHTLSLSQSHTTMMTLSNYIRRMDWWIGGNP